MATIPFLKSETGLEYRNSIVVPINGGTAVPATGTNEYILTRLDRKVRFREFGIVGQQTITTSAPATNYMTAQLRNFSQSTLMVSGTVVGAGATPGTISLNRGTYSQLGTLGKFTGGFAIASAQNVISIRFTATVTLNRGLTNPVVELVGDFAD